MQYKKYEHVHSFDKELNIYQTTHLPFIFLLTLSLQLHIPVALTTNRQQY